MIRRQGAASMHALSICTTLLTAAFALSTAGEGSSAPAASAAGVDDVYIALSDLDYDRADSLSLDLLGRTEQSPAAEAAALQARIELLFLRHRLDTEAGKQLAAAIDEFAKSHAQGRALPDMLELYRSAANSDARGAASEASMQAAAPRTPAVAAETRYIEVLRAFRAHDLKQVAELAPDAIAVWHAERGLNARLNE